MSEDENKDSQEEIEQSELDLNNDEPLEVPVKEETKPVKKHIPLTKEQYVEKYGSEEGYKTEDEWNNYGKAYEELKPLIHGINKKLDEREKEIKALISYNERLSQEKFEKKKRELSNKIQEAKENLNSDDVERFTMDKVKLEQEERQAVLTRDAEEKARVIKNFSERNKHWFNNDHPELVEEVQNLEKLIAYDAMANNEPMTYEKMAQTIEERMERKYKDIISRPQPRPVPVITRTQQVDKPVSQSYDKTFNSLDEDLKYTFKALNRNNPTYWTKERYLKKLKQDGEI